MNVEMSNNNFGTTTTVYATRVVSVNVIRSYHRYKGQMVAILGVIQILMGLWSIALGIAHPLTFSYPFGHVGYGIWGGVVYCVAGVVGILSYRIQSAKLIVSHMVLSIISAVLALLQLCLGVGAAYMDHQSIRGIPNYGDLKRTTQGYPEKPYAGTVVVDCLLAVSAIIEGLVAIVASAIGCGITCCNGHFAASQQEIDNPHVQTYEVREKEHKYMVNPSRF